MDLMAQPDWARWGSAAPGAFALLFLAASGLMLWRLEALSRKGFEGTVLGTLVMPYCSGVGNLVFAYVLGRQGGNSAEVITNSLVNNVTNLTLLIGLPTIFWGASWRGRKPRPTRAAQRTGRIHQLSLLFTLLAGLFFTGILWALARDGRLDRTDGLVLVGVFAFWQVVHVFEVLKANVRQGRSLPWSVYPELLVLLAGAVAVYVSIEALVGWIGGMQGGLFSPRYLGWVSAWLMVLPNAMLGFYYAGRDQPEVMYASQVGDGHICIPLGVGVYALMAPARLPGMFDLAIPLLAGALVLHVLFVLAFGRLPRLLGWFLVAAYGVFLWRGLPR